MTRKASASNTLKQYSALQSALHELPWLLNGSVMKIVPRSNSPNAHTTYTWTRKINAKTVTVALSKEQYRAFREAIEANRRLEKILKQMRKLSEKVLLETLPGVKRKPRSSPTEK
jgi:hypothetical protein